MKIILKYPGIMCKLYWYDDYHYSDCIECKTCGYSVACRSKFDEEALDKAYANLDRWAKANRRR